MTSQEAEEDRFADKAAPDADNVAKIHSDSEES
jgi:hypothetical protein